MVLRAHDELHISLMTYSAAPSEPNEKLTRKAADNLVKSWKTLLD